MKKHFIASILNVANFMIDGAAIIGNQIKIPSSVARSGRRLTVGSFLKAFTRAANCNDRAKEKDQRNNNNLKRTGVSKGTICNELKTFNCETINTRRERSSSVRSCSNLSKLTDPTKKIWLPIISPFVSSTGT